jgi:hypothetical protein
MPIVWVIAFDEVLEILELERIGLKGEMLVGSQVIDPQLLCPMILACRLAVEE